MTRALALVGVTLSLALVLVGQRLQAGAPPGPRGDIVPNPAVAEKKVASALFPKSTKVVHPQPDPLRAGHDLKVGIFYYNRGDYVGALSRFESAIYNNPALAEAYCRAGDTELHLQRLAPARSEWRRCLAAAGQGEWASHASRQLRRNKERS